MSLQLEQLAHGKGDQRQLVDRRAVLLLRRAQNGEMDEIDGGIGFQQRAPGALAGMGLAGDQQHLQPVAHAIDQGDGRVVGEAQLLGPRLDREFEDVLAAMVDVEIEGHVLADGDLHRRQGLAVLHDVDAGQRARRGRAILDPELEGDVLVDDAEAGGGRHDEAPVGFVGQAAQQHMHRCAEAEGIEIGRDVVDLPVADEDGAGDAARRQIGDRLGQSGEEPRAAAVHRLARGLVAGMDDAKLQPGDRLDALLDLGQSGGGLLAPRRDVLALEIVDHDHGDIVQIFAVLADGRGIGQGRQQRGAGDEAPEAAARPAPEGDRQQDHRQDSARHQQGPGQQRREFDAEGAEAHWPSLSRIAGTCTWSDL